LISNNTQEILEARYFQGHEMSWEGIAERVGKAIGGNSYGDKYTDSISKRHFIPAGRILRNAGRRRGSLFNCYCLPIGDSREEIGELFKNALILWGEGGGVGINFSTLRPKGAEIKGVGGKSSGLVSFMRAVDGIAATVESGGQRRAASLGLCEVWHSDIEDFIKAKGKDGDISYFNISVGINQDFIDAVRMDEEWPIHFNQNVSKRISAKRLWNRIMLGMVKNGEPGIINMSNLTSNNSYYFAPVRGTNPCGETCLEDYGVCNLGSVVLPKFVVNGRVKWKELEEVIRLGVRFLDTCIDLNMYSLERIKQTAKRGRRIGLGVMGLADMLFNLKLRYGSRDAIDYIENLMKFIRNISYDESCKLAQEKGAFPAFESNLYCKAKFIRSLPPSLRSDIRKHGTRNVTLLAIAPTGTISLIPETTSSIEPLMYKAYERNDRVSKRYYIHPLYNEFLNDGSTGASMPEWFVDSTDLSPQHHIDTQIAVQKYVDGAVSKTINVPKSFKKDQLSGLLLESIDDLKGVTVYRDGSRKNQIIRPLTNSQALERVRLGRSSEGLTPEAVSCATGSCDLD
jgi:ribonucleoside-diphosphate reductase alpha chain